MQHSIPSSHRILYVSPALHVIEMFHDPSSEPPGETYPSSKDTPPPFTPPSEFTWATQGQTYRRINYQYYLWLESKIAALGKAAETGKINPGVYLQALVVWRDIAKRCAERMDPEKLAAIKASFDPAKYKPPASPKHPGQVKEISPSPWGTNHPLRPYIPNLLSCPHESHRPLSERPCPHLVVDLTADRSLPISLVSGGGPWCANCDESTPIIEGAGSLPTGDHVTTSPSSLIRMFRCFEFRNCEEIEFRMGRDRSSQQE